MTARQQAQAKAVPAAAKPHADLSQRLGHAFADGRWLETALTHRSFGVPHNERLEFLGDAVLNLAVSRLLFGRFADSDEGDLTRVRAHLVREDSLHQAALALGLPPLLRLSDGEARAGGAQRASILADALEALIGAVYLDGGFEAALALVRRLFGERIEQTGLADWGKDAKTELQEWLQARKLPVPAYRVVTARGLAHEQVFEVECAVAARGVALSATGRSRRAAEQAAAQRVLQTLLRDSPDATRR